MGYQALLFCSDEKLVRVVSQVFSELDFVLDPVTEPFAAVKKLMAQHFDAVVVDCENEQNSALVFKSARNSSSNQGSLAIALVEGQAGVAKAYRIGANLVLTKPINVEQAKGTLRVARGLLRKNSDAPPTASHAAAAGATAGATSIAAPTPSFQSANRIVEANVPPPTRGQSPEFEVSVSTTASSAATEEKAAPVPAPAKDWSSLAAQAPAAPVSLSSSKVAWEEIKITEAPTPAVVPVLNPSSRSQGPASTPVPAKEVVTPAKKQTEKDERAEVAKTEATARLGASFSTTVGSTSETPSFTFLDDEARESGGNKKLLIAAVAVLVLAGAGYFGWTKFGPTGPATSQQLVTTTPQRPAEPMPDSSTMATSAPAPSPSATGRQGATTISPAPKTSSVQLDQPSTYTGSTSVTRIAIRPETEAKESGPAPLLVKSGGKSVRAQSQSEESSAQLPSPLTVVSPGDSGLNGVLSASSNVARPTLAQIKVSQGVSQGLVIKRVQPKYPPSALSAHLQGAVQIEVTVNKEGIVTNPKVLSGDRVLAAAALEAVRQWRYKPYYLNGEPIEIQTQITVNFKTQ